MRFSVWPSYDRSWDEITSLAAYADGPDSPWHGVWFADHFMPQTDDDTVSAEPAMECWTVLAALAATTNRVRLTSMVSPVTIHHPVVLTKRAATTDVISDGRVTLGVGAGWQVNEHQAYGFELPAVGERVTRFAEALEVMHRLLRATDSTSAVDHHGPLYRLRAAPLNPPGAQSPVPLLVGTGSPRMMRITARLAEEWNTWGDPTQLAERMELFRQACDAVGRDPSTVRRSAQAMVFLTDDDAATDKLRQRAPAGRSLVGQTAELIDLLGTYVDAGVDEFAVPDFTLGKSSAQRLETIDRLASEVLVALT